MSQTTTEAPDAVGAAVRPRSFALAVLALATGGFAIGTTEFVTMGVLPQLADGVDVSIPVAGRVISAYALGVVVGAPVVAYFGARLPRQKLLVGLMAAYAAFNALSALAPNYPTLVVARFFDGLPHGGYFGVASLVAASMVAPERRGRAIALVLMGLPVANVVGVPAATWLGQTLGWRASYWVVAALAGLTIAMVLAFVPDCPGNPEATGRRELLALRKPQVWFAIVAGAIGFGGMFALFSYVAPLATRVADLPDSAVPVFLLTLGVGMVFGNWVAGRAMDWSLRISLLGAPVALAVSLLVAWLLAPYGYASLPALFAVTTFGSVLALGLMMRLIDAAEHAETIGAALSHGSLNIGNALGAWLGGVTIAAGFGYRSPLAIGVLLSLAGFAVLAVGFALDRRPAAHSEAVTS
ncbi:MAG TPA: MFS transporter [Nocardioides sp.]|uniref:MFS transporter n=1 Tax=Nocardioides sp. TaxID=35761 RepID=UPI002E35603A|nr:MFS transporter [Nocardioides sp.]HEX5090393.1 MFS transporter [Nocardioides sp.]